MQIISDCVFVADKIELGESDLKMMLKKHHEKRKRQPVRCQEVWGGGTAFYLVVFEPLAVTFRGLWGDLVLLLCAATLQPRVITCV